MADEGFSERPVLSPLGPLDWHKGWRARAILATSGNNTALGCVIIAMFGRATENPPRIRSGLVILEDGTAQFVLQARRYRLYVVEVKLSLLLDSFRWLLDHIRATDDEAQEMMIDLRLWISSDERAVKELAIRHREAGVAMDKED